MAEQLRPEKSIFLSAIELDEAERAAFLDEACAGEPRLRGEVEALLQAHEKPQRLLDVPSVPAPTVDQPLTERPGTQIGPYKLLEQIGEGGFGVVFMAEQQEPVRRKVALKILKPGMDTRQVIARFEAERQALAIMAHPNIAHVHDGGATPSGRPYFVMELVRGVAITDYCDQVQMPPRERLGLFLSVCQAIQHAHQKGIIHRDIKPSNVLVTEQDGKPLVKIIDFGIAKATGQQLTAETLFTNFAQMIGTPLYMSPEQAGMSTADVDTRSDIYSLGVLLYELLTGTTPFDKERMKRSAYDEIRRIIREEEPPKPSTRLSDSGEALASISSQRHMEPAKLTKLVKGELDWIVMKALEKDRNRRYETANGFAADVQRYLADEPVQAGPPSVGYRLRKFVRRNKGPVLAACLVTLTLIGGLIGTTVGLIEAHRQREVAEARAAEAGAVLEFVETRVLAAARPEGQEGGLGREITLRKAIEAALPFVETSFTDQPLIKARLRMTLGWSFWYLGDANSAADHFQAARTLYSQHRGFDHADTLQSMYSLAVIYADLGRYGEAFELREETLRLRTAKLGPDHPDTFNSMMGLAASYHFLGRHAEALKLHEETLKLRKGKLGPDHPDTLWSMAGVAWGYAALDRHAEALKLREQVLELRKTRFGAEHPDTLLSMYDLGNSYAALGRHADALDLGGRTLALRKSKLGPVHPDTVRSTLDVADSLMKLGRGAEAVPIIDECATLAAGNVVAQRLIPDLMDLRLRHFEKTKDTAGCRATAETWEKLNRTDANSLYNAACMRAVTADVLRATDRSPEAARQADAEADRAMAWLHKAVAAGFKSAGHMVKDTALDALRGREDFKKLLAELEGKKE